MTQSLDSVDGPDSETNAGSTTGTSAVKDWPAMVLVLQDPAPKTFGVLDVAGTAAADDEVSYAPARASARGARTARSGTAYLKTPFEDIRRSGLNGVVRGPTGVLVWRTPLTET